MKLSKIIKQYRKENNLTGPEFAERCGLSKGYISQIENETRGNSSPKIASLSKLAQGMNITLNDLMKMMDGDSTVDVSIPHTIESKDALLPESDRETEKELKELILKKFKSLRQFAEYIDIPATTINTILKRGIKNANFSNAISICRALDLDVDKLASGIFVPTNVTFALELTHKENRLIEKIRSLTNYEQETVEILVDRFIDNHPTLKVEDVPMRYVTLPAYGYAPSAGAGNYMPDDIPQTSIQVPATAATEKADFIVKVGGHSMEPKYKDGDLVLVKKTDAIDHGKIGIFSVNGEALIKECQPNRLHSLNPAYPDIQLNDGDTVRCLGEVIGKL